METRAVARFVRIAPRKARQVIDLIRGKKVDDALQDPGVYAEVRRGGHHQGGQVGGGQR